MIPECRRRGATLRPGETVSVTLRGRFANTINISAYGGTVLGVDPVALRVAVSWRRLGTLPPSTSTGEVVIPWPRVDRIKVEGVAR